MLWKNDLSRFNALILEYTETKEKLDKLKEKLKKEKISYDKSKQETAINMFLNNTEDLDAYVQEHFGIVMFPFPEEIFNTEVTNPYLEE